MVTCLAQVDAATRAGRVVLVCLDCRRSQHPKDEDFIKAAGCPDDCDHRRYLQSLVQRACESRLERRTATAPNAKTWRVEGNQLKCIACSETIGYSESPIADDLSGALDTATLGLVDLIDMRANGADVAMYRDALLPQSGTFVSTESYRGIVYLLREDMTVEAAPPPYLAVKLRLQSFGASGAVFGNCSHCGAAHRFSRDERQQILRGWTANHGPA
jgi:hypothetical protein